MKNQGARTIIGYFLLVIMVITLICGFSSMSKGFDKKDNYENYESFPSFNKNAYVGGDAYNYIINGTYFTGYCVLAGSMYIVAAVCGTSGLMLLLCDKHAESTKFTAVEQEEDKKPIVDDNEIENKAESEG